MAPSLALLLFTFLGFISLGLPDAITGVVWPSASLEFGVPLGNLGFILVSFTSGYLAASFSIVSLIRRLGVGGLLTVSCTVVVASLAGFGFAPSFGWYVASAFFAGLGAGAIDTGLNAFASRHFSAKHMSWLHACWAVGATTGAAIAAFVLAEGFSWRWTYAVIAAALIPITMTFTLVRRIWEETSEEMRSTQTPSAPLTQALKHPVVWLQAFIFFVYVGAESTIGQWSYTLLTKYRDVAETSAGWSVTLYWTSLTLGRFLLGSIADRISPRLLLTTAISTSFVGGLLFVLSPSPTLAACGLVVLGLSLAPIYPGMMSQTPARLAHLSEAAIGFQIAIGLLGQVFVPSLGGILIESLGLGALNLLPAFLLAVLWVAFIVLFWSPWTRLSKRVAITEAPASF